MFSPKVKLDRNLYDRVVQAARKAGYASPEEFIRHIIEREVAALEEADSDEKVEERLRGLGYIE